MISIGATGVCSMYLQDSKSNDDSGANDGNADDGDVVDNKTMDIKDDIINFQHFHEDMKGWSEEDLDDFFTATAVASLPSTIDPKSLA